MKKISVFIIILLLSCLKNYAYDYDIYCKSRAETNEGKNIFGKINTMPVNIIEFAISKNLNKQFNGDFKADLSLFGLKRLKNGEFKKLKLESPRIEYHGMSLSSFKAESLCRYNRVIYKNHRVYFPDSLPMSFNAEITNKDLEYIVKSGEFKQKALLNGIKINGKDLIKLLEPQITVQDSKIYLKFPVKTIFSKKITDINLTAGVKAEDNNILLNDISFLKNSNIIVIDVADYFKKNPIAITNSALDGRFCRIYISQAEVAGNVIKAEGIFIINKDYGGQNE